MSLATRLADLTTRIGTEFKALRVLISGSGTGTVSGLTTTATNLVGAINEVRASVASSAGISDSTTTTTSTWSSSKISGDLANKADLVAGKVPSGQLPAYVDDVLEFANLAAFPGTGTAGIIYVAQDTNKPYRWSGSAYVEISASPGSTDAVTEGATNLYFTTARAKAAAVADTITDAVTDVAPSQNAVFDALAGKQPLHAVLTSLAAQSIAAGKLPYGSGSNAFSLTDLTAAGRALLDDADAAAQCVTLGIGNTDQDLVAVFETALA